MRSFRVPHQFLLPSLVLVSVHAALHGQVPDRAQTSRTALTKGSIAITNVAVVPMTSDTVIRDATVLIRNGRITSVGPAASTKIPVGARRIDGRGRYVIPGLADMHAHLFSDDEAPDSAGPAELGVYLANGVTTARLMIGTPEHLILRRDIEAGTIAGPQLWIASPQFMGRPGEHARVVTTPAEARAAVDEVADSGFDFIKLTVDITLEVFEAIVTEAAVKGLPVVGHVDPRVGVARALAAHQHIEHLDNYMESALADSAPMRNSVSDIGVFRLTNWESIDWVDDAKVAQLGGATARAGVYVTPTLNMFKTAFAQGQPDSVLHARPDWNMMPPAWRALYLRANAKYWSNPPTAARRQRYIEIRNAMVRAIADSGGHIMAGSDTPDWFHVYGWALHRELQCLVAAGLTPYQALAAATVTPAAFLGASAEWGTIQVGKRADLVLLAANPLDDISNTTRIEGVMVGGRWFNPPELARMIQRSSLAIDGTAPDS